MADVKARRRRRRLAVTVLLLAGAAVAAFLVLRPGNRSTPTAPATETVRKGDVRSTVAGVGTLQAEKSVSLGFGAGGRVNSVEVKLGQKVKAGQVLARLDDTLPQASLRAAEAQASAANAKLSQLTEAHTPPEYDKVTVADGAAARAVAAARRTATKAHAVAKAEVSTLRSNVRQAKKNHAVAVKRLGQSRTRLAAKKSRAATSKTAYESAKEGVEAARAQIVALAGTREADRKKAEEDEKHEREKGEAERAAFEAAEKIEREAAEAEGKEFKGKEFHGREITPRNTETGTGYAEAQASSQLESAQSILTEAQTVYERYRTESETLRTSLPELRSTVRSSAEAVATAEKALASGRATSAQTLRTSQETAETARSTLRTTESAGKVELQPTKSGEMGEAIAAISQAESNVASSKKALEETVLRAPASGRVSSLKVAVGDVVSGGSTSQNSLAQGGGESAGGEGGSTEGGASGEGESGAPGASGGSGSSGGPSIVLTSPHLKQFAVLLTQGDAVKVSPGDSATLTIDALSSTVKGKVTSITPLPQVKNGVVNYTAMIATSKLPEKLRVGMTAEVTVLTANRHDVPVVSPAALPASTGTVRVQVLDHGKHEPRTVHLGLAGDEDVEIKSGLKPGDRVILPNVAEPGGEEFGGEGGFPEEGFGEEGFEE